MEILAILEAILAGGRRRKSLDEGRSQILAGVGDSDQGRPVEMIQVNFETVYRKAIQHLPQGPPLQDKLESMVEDEEIMDISGIHLDTSDNLQLYPDLVAHSGLF